MAGFSRMQAESALLLGWTQEEVKRLHLVLDRLKLEVDQVGRWGVLAKGGTIWYQNTDPVEQSIRNSRLYTSSPSSYFTDGSGTTFDKPAGIGVFAQHERYQDFIAENIGPGTNNRAELVAIWRALRDSPSVFKQIKIFSDSEYAIGSCTKDWRPNANAPLIKAMREDLALRHPGVVTFEHVPGHRNIEGNEIADKLANIGRKLVTRVTVYTS